MIEPPDFCRLLGTLIAFTPTEPPGSYKDKGYEELTDYDGLGLRGW